MHFNITELAISQKELALNSWELRLNINVIEGLPREKYFKTILLPKNFSRFNNV